MWSRRSEKKSVLSNLQEQVKQLGITQQEILSALGYIGSQKKKHRAPAKYYDPKSGKSWSGYGPKPKWIEGKDLDALLVDRGQPQPWWPERESQS
ncbi:H-NS histone family protein [Burkholderia cepacia]|uniref:H-NS histone family protein n=1 Tax=Burkholderia cepacia TaxID=292 RepID=UPI001CF16810|nr:H-NS histone family protein [Burkholderia cepacia]MCA8285272.1 H-NS histone family protein [Burkholderia cepacia]